MKGTQQISNRRNWIKRSSALCASLLFLPKNDLQAMPSAVLSGFVTEPFLQNMYTGSITVTWVAAQNSFSWVVYGTSETNLSGKVIPKKDGQAVANRQINRVQIKRLFPGRKYYYQVVSKAIIKLAAYDKQYGVEYKSQVYSFVVPNLDSTKVSAVIISDTENYAGQVKHISSVSPVIDFIHLNGNIIRRFETEQDLVSQMIAPSTETFATNTPLFYGRGIYEMRGAHAGKFYDYVETPTAQAYFSLKWGPVFFLFMDSGENYPDNDASYNGFSFSDEYRIKQQQWLKEQLESAEAQNALYRVAMMNFPTHYGGSEHGLNHCRELYAPLFNQYRVNALVAGYSGNEQVYLPKANDHKYAIIIGGKSSSTSYNFIKLDADENRLRIALTDQNGNEKGYYDSSSTVSTKKKKVEDVEVYSDGNTLWVKNPYNEQIVVCDTQGRVAGSIKSYNNELWKVQGLTSGQVYIVKVGDAIRKVLF